MANDNEAVERVCEEMTGWEHHTWMCASDHEYLNDLADRILAAHNQQMAAKDKEIERLRALVKELSEIVDGPLCHQDCAKCPPDTRCASKRLRALVAKAREVVK